MDEYSAVYKCRLCGEVFSTREFDKDTARFACTGLAIAEHIPDQYTGFHLFRNLEHFCKDGSYGIADIQGFKKVGG